MSEGGLNGSGGWNHVDLSTVMNLNTWHQVTLQVAPAGATSTLRCGSTARSSLPLSTGLQPVHHATHGGPSGRKRLPTHTTRRRARFSPTGSMTTPCAGHTATMLLDGDVLTVGGQATSSGFVGSAKIFHP
jgi:hypothetical protein